MPRKKSMKRKKTVTKKTLKQKEEINQKDNSKIENIEEEINFKLNDDEFVNETNWNEDEKINNNEKNNDDTKNKKEDNNLNEIEKEDLELELDDEITNTFEGDDNIKQWESEKDEKNQNITDEKNVVEDINENVEDIIEIDDEFDDEIDIKDDIEEKKESKYLTEEDKELLVNNDFEEKKDEQLDEIGEIDDELVWDYDNVEIDDNELNFLTDESKTKNKSEWNDYQNDNNEVNEENGDNNEEDSGDNEEIKNDDYNEIKRDFEQEENDAKIEGDLESNDDLTNENFVEDLKDSEESENYDKEDELDNELESEESNKQINSQEIEELWKEESKFDQIKNKILEYKYYVLWWISVLILLIFWIVFFSNNEWKEVELKSKIKKDAVKIIKKDNVNVKKEVVVKKSESKNLKIDIFKNSTKWIFTYKKLELPLYLERDFSKLWIKLNSPKSYLIAISKYDKLAKAWKLPKVKIDLAHLLLTYKYYNSLVMLLMNNTYKYFEQDWIKKASVYLLTSKLNKIDNEEIDKISTSTPLTKMIWIIYLEAKWEWWNLSKKYNELVEKVKNKTWVNWNELNKKVLLLIKGELDKSDSLKQNFFNILKKNNFVVLFLVDSKNKELSFEDFFISKMKIFAELIKKDWVKVVLNKKEIELWTDNYIKTFTTLNSIEKEKLVKLLLKWISNTKTFKTYLKLKITDKNKLKEYLKNDFNYNIIKLYFELRFYDYLLKDQNKTLKVIWF